MHVRRGRGRGTATLKLIDTLIDIAAAIQPCSVRALAYQLFNRKLIPSMARENVGKISRACLTAREEGMMPWEWIVDSTRQLQKVSTWDDPKEFGRSVMASYRRNKWEAQPKHVMFWSEKGTVEGTIQPVLEKYEVPFVVMHGFAGSTPVWDAAQANLARDQDTLILYIGDLDPSGMGMSELDLPKRLARYSSNDPSEKDLTRQEVEEILLDARLEIRRVALTLSDGWNVLGEKTAFPASDKKDDTRHDWFVQQYGNYCWELDAMSPNVLRWRVEDAIVENLDTEIWERYVHAEKVEQEAIAKTCRSWTSILRPDQKYSDDDEAQSN